MRQNEGYLPVLDWIAGYRRAWLRQDIVAGLTTAAVVIPKAMAYATIAGLPVQVGLYTAFIPMLIYAVFGSSRPLSVSTSTTLAILAAAQLALGYQIFMGWVAANPEAEQVQAENDVQSAS